MYKYCVYFFMIQACYISFNLAINNVYVIGDSHCRFCFSNNLKRLDPDWNNLIKFKDDILFKKNLLIHWIGPFTMYRVGKDQLKLINLKNIGVKNDDIIIWMFGEIDVRCHILKQRDLNRISIDKIISTLAKKYIDCILNNNRNYTNLMNVIMGVVPPSNQGFNKEFPFYGSLEERVSVTNKLNKCLDHFCKLNKLVFCPIPKLYKDNKGALRHDLSDGHVHIKDNIHVKLNTFKIILNHIKG